MADLIERQAAIDALERSKDKTAKGDIGGFYNAIVQNDIDKIKDLPSAQPEPQWILCSERLPDVNGRYLVSYEDAVDMLEFFNGHWFFIPLLPTCVEETGTLQAWMPLPEPWKGEKNEQS